MDYLILVITLLPQCNDFVFNERQWSPCFPFRTSFAWQQIYGCSALLIAVVILQKAFSTGIIRLIKGCRCLVQRVSFLFYQFIIFHQKPVLLNIIALKREVVCVDSHCVTE